MQRNIDLLRQLLFDVERRGASSAIDSLRCDLRHDTDERVRYHLRLLIDAGFLKEAGQTSVGTPCVRLTHAGQEFIELARSDARWREAKAIVLAATGGVTLTILKKLLNKWASRRVARIDRRRVVSSRPPRERAIATWNKSSRKSGSMPTRRTPTPSGTTTRPGSFANAVQRAAASALPPPGRPISIATSPKSWSTVTPRLPCQNTSFKDTLRVSRV
jgi:hypothetical protein